MRPHRGFTLLELMMVVLIMSILAALAYPILNRQRPRATLLGTSTELFALLRNARQNALSTGRNTVVLVFPNQANSRQGTGRVVVLEDPNATMFGATAPNFTSFNAAQTVSTSNLLGELAFPPGITVGLGGKAAPTLAAPYTNLPAPGACTFCATSGDGRGAIVFDYRGRARFYSAVGNPLSVFGGTLALQATPQFQGYRMLVVGAATGTAFTLFDG